MGRISILALVLLSALLVFWLSAAGAFNSGERALLKFRSTDRHVPEDQLADPLIITGSRAVPAVLAAISDTTLPYRRYAIGYLGWTGDRRAIPALQAILVNPRERSYFRADALEAIACIRVTLGDSLAAAFTSDTADLGQAASRVFDGPECVYEDRSFWDALFYVHE